MPPFKAVLGLASLKQSLGNPKEKGDFLVKRLAIFLICLMVSSALWAEECQMTVFFEKDLPVSIDGKLTGASKTVVMSVEFKSSDAQAFLTFVAYMGSEGWKPSDKKNAIDRKLFMAVKGHELGGKLIKIKGKKM
jgi:hypothetical protein